MMLEDYDSAQREFQHAAQAGDQEAHQGAQKAQHQARLARRKDYYKVLGVSKTADRMEIKRAYRKLAMSWHPDKNPGNLEAEKKFKEIGEAFNVLSNDDKRAKYDSGEDEQGGMPHHGSPFGNFQQFFQQGGGGGFQFNFGGGGGGGGFP